MNIVVVTVPASPPPPPPRPSPNVEQTPSPDAIVAEFHETWLTNDEMSDKISANDEMSDKISAIDFEKQVLGRMDSNIIEFRQMTHYKMTKKEKETIDKSKTGALAQFVPNGRVTWNTNKETKQNTTPTTPQSPADRKNSKDHGLPNNIECDMFMHVQKVKNDNEEIGVFSYILESVTEKKDVFQLNPGYDKSRNEALPDVMLQADDHLWIEIAETPDSIPGKLWQLNRAYVHFETQERPLAKVAVICLNGEKDLYDDAVKIALNHWNADELTSWTILKKIPVYVLYTPNRNVYRSLHKIETQMATKSDLVELRSDLEGLRKTMATMETNLAEVLAAVKSSSSQSWRPWWLRWRRANSHDGGQV